MLLKVLTVFDPVTKDVVNFHLEGKLVTQKVVKKGIMAENF